MNLKHADKPTKKAFWLRWPFLVTAIPLSLLLLCLIAVAVHEKLALERTEAELARIRAAGLPVDNASMTQWFLEITSQEGTPAWNEILRLVAAGPTGGGNFEKLPYIGTAPIPDQIEPPEDWPEEQEVAEYLRWMRPVIEQIHEATEYPTPVWQPIQFRGYSTLLEELQSSRNLIRLLSVDVEHALSHGDAPRALRGLDSMGGVAAAFDWEICMVADLIQIALRQVHQSMIRRSLAIDPWNEEQLQALRKQLEPARDVASHWPRVIGGERAMMLAAINDGDLWQDHPSQGPPVELLLSVPSLREPLIRAYGKIEAIGAEGLPRLTKRAKTIIQDSVNRASSRQRVPLLFSQSLVGMLVPAIEAFASAIEREETSRRFSLTAVAIKSFQLRTGQWPERLTQLEQIGLTARDWNTVGGGRFGYQIAGDEVYLWSYEPHEESRVSPTRPELDAEDPDSTPAWVTIR